MLDRAIAQFEPSRALACLVPQARSPASPTQAKPVLALAGVVVNTGCQASTATFNASARISSTSRSFSLTNSGVVLIL
jgi:hypothetical protein